MINIIFKLFILFFIIFLIKNIVDVNKFNTESNIITLDNIELVKGKNNILDPLIINYDLNFNYNLNDIIKNNLEKYIINKDDTITKLSDFTNNNNISIIDNDKLYELYEINDINKNILKYINNLFSFNCKNSLSILKGNSNSNIIKNKNNINVISLLSGDIDVYLFNPKHNNIILDENFKKWASKINLTQNNLLYIPPNWKYYIESNKDTIYTNLKCDNYFTFIYNEYK